jgi:hypothetical protein
VKVLEQQMSMTNVIYRKWYFAPKNEIIAKMNALYDGTLTVVD